MSKDWTGTANSIFKQLGSSNHCDDEREKNDYYATDPKAIDDLLKVETFNKKIWECASGGGHLVDKLKENGYEVFSSDIVDRGHQDQLIDFLSPLMNPISRWDGDIITNPPYKFTTEFILKSLELIDNGHKIAMFLKLTTLEGADRYLKIYKDNPPYKIYVYSKRIQCAKNGEFKGSSAVCYAWFVWIKGNKNLPVIDWIYN